jgi:translocation and assembly module TamB
MDGKNMVLSPFERTRALTDGWVRLKKDSRNFVLDGELSISRLSWRREIYEKFGFSATPYYQSRREKGFFDDLSLNLRLRAGENAWMENSLGRISGRFDLTISGNVYSPLVLGDIEALGGEVYFQDRKFKVMRGRLSFFNPASVEPFLDFRGETYVKDYRVTFSLNGLINNLRPEFSSSPPLPPEDVLALLALGEAFRRSYSYDTSTRLSTASLLSFQIAEQAQKRAEGLFSLARFRIDPFVLGSSAEMTARLTVGRQISRNLSILYSTNLTTQRGEIVRMEWDLGRDFSLVGMRNELGRISFDVKIRKRF